MLNIVSKTGSSAQGLINELAGLDDWFKIEYIQDSEGQDTANVSKLWVSEKVRMEVSNSSIRLIHADEIYAYATGNFNAYQSWVIINSENGIIVQLRNTTMTSVENRNLYYFLAIGNTIDTNGNAEKAVVSAVNTDSYYASSALGGSFFCDTMTSNYSLSNNNSLFSGSYTPYGLPSAGTTQLSNICQRYGGTNILQNIYFVRMSPETDCRKIELNGEKFYCTDLLALKYTD